MKEVLVVRTGTANLASVACGLARAGATPRIVDDPAAVASADAVVLPGVGAFGAAMETLSACALAGPLVARIARGAPTLAICLGVQLFAASSEETDGVAGLGVFDGRVERFTGDVRVPQLGWNRVAPENGSRFIEPGFAYFANSYCLRDLPPGWTGAYADYGGRFVAAVERGAVLGCQFHPELSGRWGTELIARWLEAA